MVGGHTFTLKTLLSTLKMHKLFCQLHLVKNWREQVGDAGAGIHIVSALFKVAFILVSSIFLGSAVGS